jgi:hypothetical protein
MSDRYWGVMYLVRPEWKPADDDDNDDNDDIVHVYQHGRSHVKVATELWTLLGETTRVEEIRALMDKAYGRKPPMLMEEDIETLLQLIEGLEQRLIGTVVDKHWNVRTDQLPELRLRTTMLPLEEGPGRSIPESGVATGMSRVWALRGILQEARDEHLRILMD